MKVRCTVFVLCFASALSANDAVDRAHQLEDRGDSAGARQAYAEALRDSPQDPEVLNSYAQFLEVFRDPAASVEWRKAADAWKTTGKNENAAAAARRAILLDLIVGNRSDAEKDLANYHELGGEGLNLPAAAAPTSSQTADLPGPYSGFARMAAISTDARPEDVLTDLARTIVTNGYHASHGSDSLEETEFLKLVDRYLSQARELQQLAGPEQVIKVPNCDSTQTNDLLRILGYRMRGGCGSEVILETLNAQRAFITTDSGFPLAELEQNLRLDKPFSYPWGTTKLPILYTTDYWLPKEKANTNFVVALLADEGLARFYLAMSKLDPETADGLRQTIAPARLRAEAGVLDFFGGSFQIRHGRAMVPGGQRATAVWTELAGVSPERGAEFYDKLMVKDDGWLASEYDALSRIHGPVADYLLEPARLKRFYGAIRGRITTPGPARPVFRSNTDMMLLTTRLRLDPDGRAHIPGDLGIWKELFEKSPKNKYDPRIARAAGSWKEPDDLIEALFALCRKPVDNDALRMFMGLTDIDRNRAQPLQPATVQRLIAAWSIFGPQYTMFNDAPALSDKTIIAWMDAAQAADKIRDGLFRTDNIAMLQGLSGLWQIFSRQGSVPASKADETLAALIAPFPTIKTSRDLFAAGRNGINVLLKTAGTTSGTIQEHTLHDQTMQDHMLGLLAGGPRLDDSNARLQVVQQEQRIFDAQALLPADLLFDLADNLDGVAKGGKLNAQLAARLASRVADIDLPRNSITGAEKSALSVGFYADRHIDDERKLNLRALIDKAAKDPERIKDVSGLLAPALRDTIVGYNYIHYSPPGAQILLTNPLFVRGHDFTGMQGANRAWRETLPYSGGWPSNGGGRLVGSLIGLPYALADSEQNFLVPTHTQALIWGDLVPQMMISARTPRFWTVTPAQMHWVGLHMRDAESVVAEAAVNSSARDDLYTAVYNVASPQRAAKVMGAVAAGDAAGALAQLTPSELYTLAQMIPSARDGGPAATEIAHLKAQFPDQVSVAAISRAWGTPKPTLANSLEPELLNLRTFPSLMGYSSRIMAESWESNLLYWADIGDQMGTAPADLNVDIPEWTQKMVERMFASHLEDWPALLRSLRSVGDELKAPPPRAANTTARGGS